MTLQCCHHQRERRSISFELVSVQKNTWYVGKETCKEGRWLINSSVQSIVWNWESLWCDRDRAYDWRATQIWVQGFEARNASWDVGTGVVQLVVKWEDGLLGKPFLLEAWQGRYWLYMQMQQLVLGSATTSAPQHPDSNLSVQVIFSFAWSLEVGMRRLSRISAWKQGIKGVKGGTGNLPFQKFQFPATNSGSVILVYLTHFLFISSCTLHCSTGVQIPCSPPLETFVNPSNTVLLCTCDGPPQTLPMFVKSRFLPWQCHLQLNIFGWEMEVLAPARQYTRHMTGARFFCLNHTDHLEPVKLQLLPDTHPEIKMYHQWAQLVVQLPTQNWNRIAQASYQSSQTHRR